MSPLEHLARDIAWVELKEKPQGMTRSHYWESLSQDTRQGFVDRATWLVWINKRIPNSISWAS